MSWLRDGTCICCFPAVFTRHIPLPLSHLGIPYIPTYTGYHVFHTWKPEKKWLVQGSRQLMPEGPCFISVRDGEKELSVSVSLAELGSCPAGNSGAESDCSTLFFRASEYLHKMKVWIIAFLKAIEMDFGLSPIVHERFSTLIHWSSQQELSKVSSRRLCLIVHLQSFHILTRQRSWMTCYTTVCTGPYTVEHDPCTQLHASSLLSLTGWHLYILFFSFQK